jgi:integrase
MAYIRASKAKGKKRWEWAVRLRGYPHRHGTCPTKACAKTCADKAERELKAGFDEGRHTVRELIDLYETDYLPQIPRTAHKYRQHLDWWRKELGAYLVRAVTPRLVAAAKAHLKEGKTRRGSPRSDSTVNRYVTTLSSVWTWAMTPAVGIAQRHVVREVEPFAEPPGRVRWLSRPVDVTGEEKSELEHLLRACAKSRSRLLLDAVILLLRTGCRENEIMSLQRSDVRLEEHGFTVTVEVAKTKTARFVPLEDAALDVARRRLEKTSDRKPYLFAGRDGSAASFPWTAWRTALRRAGIANFRPHDLRHTHGSYLAMLGKTLPEIMQALGHSTPTVALRYIHLSDAHKRRVAVDMNAQLTEWIAAPLLRSQATGVAGDVNGNTPEVGGGGVVQHVSPAQGRSGGSST